MFESYCNSKAKALLFIGNSDHENLHDFYNNSKAIALPFIGNSDHENLLHFTVIQRR